MSEIQQNPTADDRHHFIDAKHMICPMPVIRLQDRIKQLQPGNLLEIVATDPGVKVDIPTWCEINGHLIVSSEDLEQGYRFVIKVEGA